MCWLADAAKHYDGPEERHVVDWFGWGERSMNTTEVASLLLEHKADINQPGQMLY